MLKDLEKALMTTVVTETGIRHHTEWLEGRKDLVSELVSRIEPCGMVRGCRNLVPDPAKTISRGWSKGRRT